LAWQLQRRGRLQKCTHWSLAIGETKDKVKVEIDNAAAKAKEATDKAAQKKRMRLLRRLAKRSRTPARKSKTRLRD
jgi:hypothetical protein